MFVQTYTSALGCIKICKCISTDFMSENIKQRSFSQTKRKFLLPPFPNLGKLGEKR